MVGVGVGLRPALAALRRHDVPALRADAMAGLTVAAYLVPQVLAYAVVAGMPPVAGLWAAVAALAAYALLGSSRQLSVGPESTSAIMTAIVVAPVAAGDPRRYTALAAMLAVLVGVICLAARVARLGFLADLLSRPVLVGYLAGIALVMIVGQLERVTGVPVDGDTVPAQVASFVAGLGRFHPPTVAMAAAVLLFLLVAHRLRPGLPAPLVAVVLAALAALVLPAGLGLHLVGAVPQGLPLPQLPLVSGADVTALLLPAVGVAVVAFSDTVLTGRAFAARHRHPLDADQELLALGAANLAAGALQGFPISSSASRTVIADAAGARSQLSSVLTLVTVVAVLLVGGPVLATFPTAALGGLVVYAALRLVDAGEFRRFARFRRSEFLLAATAVMAVLVLGLLYGVLVAVGLSVFDLLRRVSRPHDGVLGFVPGVAGMHDVDDHPDAATVPGLVVYRYDAPLCFANAEDFRRRALRALDEAAPAPRRLLLNMEAVLEIDITAVDALLALCDELDHRGVRLAMAHVKHELHEDLRRSGVAARIGEQFIQPTLPTAVEAFRRDDHPTTPKEPSP
ncbi:sulfate permease [Pseudonocardia sp. 73-21]|uniref:sulfate permease n=1 Tax=Pseudonocardia sp. 73-21 TaxID=1895809 RepID=UPI000B115F20|nr:sulfate permease [Pseudonocardia sp. 73-21]